MPVLGSALAYYLLRQSGLYSIELPASLEDEIVEFVRVCNTVSPTRAVLVTEKLYPSDILTSSWEEVLKWRTDDDRVFIWIRGSREPDTSFRSAVKPFISNRYPGDQGCECTLDLIAELSVQELWRRRGRPNVGESFEAFDQTTKWVVGVLYHSFEHFGSPLDVHWSDTFLTHWAQVLALLEQEIISFGQTLEPRHAWEIIRIAGLPVPLTVDQVGNPFWSAPEKMPEREWPRFASRWQQIVEEYIRPDGQIAGLLTILDSMVPGSRKVSSWRGLQWDLLQSLPTDVIAPLLGLTIFTASPSPTMLTSELPVYPVSPIPAWWGVHLGNIERAGLNLRSSISFRPDPTSPGLVKAFPAPSEEYWLDTGAGSLTYDSTARNWHAQIVVRNIRLIYKETWRTLFITPISPNNARDGDAWIVPDLLSLDNKRKEVKVVCTQKTTGPTNEIVVQCDITVDYTAAITVKSENNEIETALGSWNPFSTLRLQAKVRDRVESDWGPERRIDVSLPLVIPSAYSPTILLRQGREFVAIPDNGDDFVADLGTSNVWRVQSTPDILLAKEGQYAISVYDGSLNPDQPQFVQRAKANVNEEALTPVSNKLWSMTYDLDDGDVFVADDGNEALEIGVVKVKERASNLSSGLLSAIRDRPAGKKPPSSSARNSLLGQFQDQISVALSQLTEKVPNSLYQYIVSSADTPTTWPVHQGLPVPEILFEAPPRFSLPGIGNGPSQELVSSSEWQNFMRSLQVICSDIGFKPTSNDFWLSGFDPSDIKATSIKAYVEAHQKLVQFAKTTSASDIFWASYPFSLVVVDGAPGAAFGQLQAVLLSPLHPARLAWAFSVAFAARKGNISQGILGFAEGWNIPYTGLAVSLTGQSIPLIAVPVDPGQEQDFATWSALAVLTPTGLAELPASAAYLPLPWGGRTGINQRVVERALKDYLNVHSHINSLAVDIRSVTQAPRSQEIDNALLQFLGAGALSNVNDLDGGSRIWDSTYRLGLPPTRDKLFQLRTDNDSQLPFEWKSYSPLSPVSADIAFIENASVHLAITAGETGGILGLIPLRRFSPPVLSDATLNQNYSTTPGEDLLGLAGLLAEIEAKEGLQALRSSPQSNALGIGLDARWEVLGTFYMDPLLLSSIVNNVATSQTAEKRLLWEWRPSWLNQERRSDGELARRPYYVVARIPTSLLKALEHRQGFTSEQAGEMLAELGYRGIGLASLYALGGTQESAAAGFFYSLRLLLPTKENPLQAGWTTSDNVKTTYCLLPVDPVYSVLCELAGISSSERRADLLAIRIIFAEDNFTRICLVPIEVKHHGNPQNPEAIPPNTDSELKRAREQLVQMSELIAEIAKSLHPSTAGNPNPLACYTKRLGFAMLLDLALSLSRVAIQPSERAKIISDILNGRVAIGGGSPVLLWFAPGSITLSGTACMVDPHKSKAPGSLQIRELFIDPAAIQGLWWGRNSTPISPDEESVRRDLDTIMVEAMSGCVSEVNFSTNDLRAELMREMGLSDSSEEQALDLPGVQNDDSDIHPISPEAGDITLDQPSPAPQKIGPSNVEVHKEYEPISLWKNGLGAEADNKNFSLNKSSNNVEVSEEQITHSVPSCFVGWNAETSRWALIGSLDKSNERVAIDFDHPKALGVFGYMGSGKSYLLGTLIEAALESIPKINMLPAPLSVVVFNYRRNASDRFELSSLAQSNQNQEDIEKLASEYAAVPQALKDVHILRLPGQQTPARLHEYEGIPSSELFFDPSNLAVEDWELLMGDPGSEALFARTIRHALGELREHGEITLEGLEKYIQPLLPTQSRRSAELRFRFIRKYISSDHGIDFGQILKPGRAVIIDLRDPLFTKEDALRFFLICANHISRVQGRFNKVVVFDEAHEYLSSEFGEKLESRIRLMRHEGTSYIFATQDVGSIPASVQRFITLKFVFSLGTRQNIEDLVRFAPEFKNQQLLGISPGYCLVQANQSINDIFGRPRLVRIRPRVTQHGGATQIFSVSDHEEESLS